MSRPPASRCSRSTSRAGRSCGAACGKKPKRTSSRCSNGISPRSWSPMKRIEVKLALPVVAPLLDVIKELADNLRKNLAAPIALKDLDTDFHSAWVDELLSTQNEEVQTLLALFDDDFFGEGVVAFDEGNAEIIVRACAAVRLRLR